jgi:hypothetical protein
MTRRRLIFLLIALGLFGFWAVDRFLIRQSGHGFVVGDQIVLAEYGYTRGGDELRWAIFRTWPLHSTEEERLLDPRVTRTSLVWPLIRSADGRMIPVETAGNIYFFEGDRLRTMRVKMNEHTDTVRIEDSRTLDDVWRYLERFRVDGV